MPDAPMRPQPTSDPVPTPSADDVLKSFGTISTPAPDTPQFSRVQEEIRIREQLKKERGVEEKQPLQETKKDDANLLSNPSLTKKAFEGTPVKAPLFASEILASESTSAQAPVKPARTARDLVMAVEANRAERGIVEKNTVRTLRTYERDIATALREGQNNLSLRTMNLEDKKYELNQEDIDPVARKKKVMIVVLSTVFLLGGGGVIGYSVYKANNDNGIAINTSLLGQDIIASEQVETIDIDPLTIAQLVETTRKTLEKETPLGQMRGIVFTKTTDNKKVLVPAFEVIARTGIGAPGTLVRALGEPFFLGTHTGDKKGFLLIFKTTFFENTVAGMFTWERTLLKDIAAFTLPRGELDYKEQEGSWGDYVINNRDWRIRKERDEFVVGYTFFDKNTIVIGTTEQGITEALTRLKKKQ